MSPAFPPRGFDEAVAAICEGHATDEQVRDFHELLLRDPAARDEYLLRVELHSRLASDPDLFPSDASTPVLETRGEVPSLETVWGRCGPVSRSVRGRPWQWPWHWQVALAASIILLLGGGLVWHFAGSRQGDGRRAVALLNRAVNARWNPADRIPRLGAPLEPGRLRLESGLAQVVFYNGARVVIEGPAELQLVSSGAAICTAGKLTAEVPPQARGFRVSSPRVEVTDLGTAFGLKIGVERAELHVFAGRVEFRPATGATGATNQNLSEGRGAVLEGTAAPRLIAADPAGFASLFELQSRSVAADALRYDQWRSANRRWNRDESLWVHLDFEQGGSGIWRLPNSGALNPRLPDAAVVGCQWLEGRWATKPALEFRGVSDRIRLSMPGTCDSVTLASWVRVQGLDRQINSLFMSDGFAPGTLHWVVRHDGVLGLTVIGAKGSHQIFASPPVMTVDQFGIWTHLAVVLDGRARRVVHYVNGQAVSRHEMHFGPPYQLGAAEIGNWNPVGFPGNDPFLSRNFSGVMDEFCLFGRALSDAEVQALYTDGKPQSDPPAPAQD